MFCACCILKFAFQRRDKGGNDNLKTKHREPLTSEISGWRVKLKRSYVSTAQVAILWAQNNGPRIGPIFGPSFGLIFLKSIELLPCIFSSLRSAFAASVRWAQRAASRSRFVETRKSVVRSPLFCLRSERVMSRA